MTDFFMPGTVYVDNSNPFAAPELTPEFQCLSVHEHPTLGTLWAVGWSRPGHFSAWDYGLSAYGVEEWRKDTWIPSPWEQEEQK